MTPTMNGARSVRAAVLLALAVTLAACGYKSSIGGNPDGGDGGGGTVCRSSDGFVCRVGERCPAPDGCNTCTCNATGEIACTLLACVDGGLPDVVAPADGGVCVFADGRTCPRGARCPAPDGCNTCTCGADGSLSCTEIACIDAGGPRQCRSQSDCASNEMCTGVQGCGVAWTCQPAVGCTADEAPFCSCNGTTVYGSSSCPPEPFAHRGTCETRDGGVPPVDAGETCRGPDGRVYNVGDGFNDGCNDCVCTPGGLIACTRRACEDASVRTCTSSSECAAGEMCTGPAGCGVSWTCQPATFGCTDDDRPYCSCRGVTVHGSGTCPPEPYAYAGECDTRDAGVRTCTSSSECGRGEMCTGPAGCGIPWTCQPGRPCTLDLRPYCACDGTTVFGSSTCPPQPYAHTGSCDTPDDAGTTPPACSSNAECPAGTLCCYPCGIEGCTNACIPPGPDGACPLFP